MCKISLLGPKGLSEYFTMSFCQVSGKDCILYCLIKVILRNEFSKGDIAVQ